jgi:hypothetical protein
MSNHQSMPAKEHETKVRLDMIDIELKNGCTRVKL